MELLEKEKNISKATLLEAIENSLLTACKNHFGKADNVKVIIDREGCDYSVYAEKEVVENEMCIRDRPGIARSRDGSSTMQMRSGPPSWAWPWRQCPRSVRPQRTSRPSVSPVSYTHLDVYKRQAQNPVPGIRSTRIVLYAAKISPPAKACFPLHRPTLWRSLRSRCRK